MRPEPPRGMGRLLRLLHARESTCPAPFACPRNVYACADAGHPPGLFAE